MDYREIVRCAVVYDEAQRRADRDAGPHLSQDVLRARVDLADRLMHAGWTPSRDVMLDLMRDGELLGRALGSFQRTPADLYQQT